jgi:hypothetical protein
MTRGPTTTKRKDGSARPASHPTARGAQVHRNVGPGRAARRRKARKPARRLSGRFVSWLAIGLVVVISAALVIVKLADHPSTSSPDSAVPRSVIQAVTGLPAATFDAIGVSEGLTPPKALPAGTASLTSGGLPRIVYIGAEYCPFCAAERWATVVALSRFGSFSRLRASESSTSDVYPGTKTFSFYGSTYRSQYVVFDAVELETNQRQGSGYAPLKSLTAEQQHLMDTLDRAPYTTTPGAIPFTDIANKYLIIGSTFNPGVLEGLSLSEIAEQLDNPSSLVARAVVGSANLLTAAICEATGGSPSAVCAGSAVTRARARLGQTR